MAKKNTENQSISDLRLQAVKLVLDIKAGKEKNTSSIKNIKKQIAQLLTTKTK